MIMYCCCCIIVLFIFVIIIFIDIITVAVVVAIVIVVVVVAVLVILKPVLLLLLLVFFLSLLVFFCSCCCYCYYCRCRRRCCCCCCCCVIGFVVVVVAFATTLIVVELKESSRVCSSKVQKSGGVRGREKAAKCAVQKRGRGWRGVGGGVQPPPLSANLPLMTLFSLRFYPLKRFRVASPSCVLEEKLLLIYSFYKGDSLSLYFVFMLYSPANTSGFRLLVCR